MLFRGTEEHPSAHALSTAFEDLGGSLEATTAADHGTLEINVPQENLSRALDLMGGVVRAPLLKDLELERGIIREEVLGDLSEEGEMIDPASLLRSLSFGDSGLGRPITGPLTNIESFTDKQLRAHHRQTYISADMVIAITGPLSVETVQGQLDSSFGQVPQGTGLKCATPTEQGEPRFVSVHHPGSSQTSISLGFRCPGRLNPQEPAVEMLLRLIDDGMATRLYHRLCDSSGLCYSASASYEAYEDCGLVEFEAETGHERSYDVVSELLRLTNEMTSELVKEQEWERIRKRTGWQFEAYRDEASASAHFTAMASLFGTVATPDLRLEELLAVTRQDIQAVAERVFARTSRSLVCVGNPRKARVDRLRSLALQ